MTTPGPVLTAEEAAMLRGDSGPGVAMAMRMVVALAGVLGAERLMPVTGAHIDSCLYHGQAGLDFAEKLASLGARVAVPTTLNSSSLDLMHPGLVRLPPEDAVPARALMDAYRALGARPTWTCAPYQSAERPAFGENVAWAESNAIVFANSVLGARTERYGDFIDICAAITGRVPHAGLHLDEHRLPTLELDCSALSPAMLGEEAVWAALGDVVGRLSGSGVPLLTGIDPASVDEDRLKALGATAASSGGVALFHVAGVTPEALTPGPGWAALPSTPVTSAMLRAARDELSTVADPSAPLDAVALGTPHFSVREFEKLAAALAGTRPFHPGCTVWINTSREVLAQAREAGLVQAAEERGARIVADTCTYITPILAPEERTVMTPSGKWAWYAPMNIGVDVVFGTLAECLASARAGRVVRDDSQWN
ncbi:aconitase X catalytic domain-containing protein [Arthrobacter sp. A2-55]|uniref:aconitase X catalytic domain-containing protein n=1 Tax=Arthrobacter sp. A2-55 TaxID=2897337 RepID=UPI0021CD5B06|nr:aconitase X catalytic domain-containing protein [Arthrobacter sp. A2-55]MCU6482413.1 aconitase X catalytic domain-containing protein [Arthrobacter sp. A2-55]